jgi:bifunctional non-homologous end joining protein LigD
MPLFRPMLATSASELPRGDSWTYEVKWDGYRAAAAKGASGVQLISRNQKNLTNDYPTVARAIAALPVREAILDGEIVALDAQGHPSFQALQHRRTSALSGVYYAFDLLDLEGESLLRKPLNERRRRLKTVVRDSHVLLSDVLPGSGDARSPGQGNSRTGRARGSGDNATLHAPPVASGSRECNTVARHTERGNQRGTRIYRDR